MNRSIAETSPRPFRSGSMLAAALLLGSVLARPVAAQTNMAAPAPQLPSWLTRPLSLADAVSVALEQNGTILKAKNDLEASYGIVVQTRAIVIPRIQVTGNFVRNDPASIETLNTASGAVALPNDNWNTGVRLVQSIYEGGRMASALRTARLTKEQALAQYQAVVADVLLLTRVAYADVLVAAQQIVVNEASVNLLSRELEDQQRRYDAGTVPRFNVLRAEVAVANARPNLIRARNAWRIAKNNLSNLLGYNLPREILDDIPLQLTDKLEAEPYQIDLPVAVQQALARRPELVVLRKAEALQQENVVNARSGYQPSVQAFAGYGWHSAQFVDSGLDDELHGWNFGGQLSWNIFDGMLTRGRVTQAKALHEKSKTELNDTARRIELDVRTAYSTFIEAREVLESQMKVQEQAEESLRLANARADAGSGTQLDVLNAETSLTQARTTQVQALHDYAVARARLARATGQDLVPAQGK